MRAFFNLRFCTKRSKPTYLYANFYFQEQSTIDNMIERILTHMLSLIRCEQAMLLLVHEKSNKTFSRVFDLDSSELEEMDANPAAHLANRHTVRPCLNLAGIFLSNRSGSFSTLLHTLEKKSNRIKPECTCNQG